MKEKIIVFIGVIIGMAITFYRGFCNINIASEILWGTLTIIGMILLCAIRLEEIIKENK